MQDVYLNAPVKLKWYTTALLNIMWLSGVWCWREHGVRAAI